MREQKKYLVIYHKEDNDGVFSGALLYDYLINTMKYDPENIGIKLLKEDLDIKNIDSGGKM